MCLHTAQQTTAQHSTSHDTSPPHDTPIQACREGISNQINVPKSKPQYKSPHTREHTHVCKQKVASCHRMFFLAMSTTQHGYCENGTCGKLPPHPPTVTCQTGGGLCHTHSLFRNYAQKQKLFIQRESSISLSRWLEEA